MKNIVIIGAGQLGSRHLQGVLKSSEDFCVFVVDPSRASIDVAKERANVIPNEHEVVYLESISDLPDSISLAIIATNSNVRLAVMEALCVQSKVENLILEKVLFQKASDYHRAAELIEERGINAYVNHPRRMQTMFQNLKDIVANYPEEVFDISAYGSNWGLGCNGLHVSDALCFVFDDKVTAYSDTILDPRVLESKRGGYKEFSGSLMGKTGKGHSFTICSKDLRDAGVSPLTIALNSPKIRIGLQEGNSPFISFTDLTQSESHRMEIQAPMLFQSDLSKVLVDQLFTGEEPKLPKYNEAMENHLLFIQSLNHHLENLTGEKQESCPIT